MDDRQFDYSEDFVSWHEPCWKRLTADIAGRADVSILEIGSFEGRSAVWWADNVATHPTSRVVCVDVWSDSARFHRFLKNVAVSGHLRRIVPMHGESAKMLPLLPVDAFDWVYVDGSHEGRDVLLDGLLALRLVRRGGVILFDDYEWVDERKTREILPGPAIAAFIAVCGSAVEVIHRGYQVAVRKPA